MRTRRLAGWLAPAVVLVVGFSVLATSSFALNSGMGLMTAIIITIALFTVFLMLPPLLMQIEKTKPLASPARGRHTA